MTDRTERPLVRLADDDADLLAAQMQALRIAGFRAEGFSDGAEALKGLTADYPGVILTDVRMPGLDGLELFRRVQAIDEDLPVILMTGHGDIAMAVEAIRAGAWDFLTKPVGLDQLAAALRRAAQARSLVMENRRLRAMRADSVAPHQLLGASPATARLREAVARIGEAGVDALITGPAGAGKEAVARAIHAEGRGRGFLHVACDALDESRFDLEFFGAEPGHAGAPRHARLGGRIEKAHRGTLFLDQADRLPPGLQARLLHVIEAREFWPVGAATPRPLEMRVLASTRENLELLAAEGRFRADLHHRLAGVTLQVPALAERREDTPILFRYFLLAACKRLNLPVPRITPQAQARLTAHGWPGNARELRQFAEVQALGAPLEDEPVETAEEGPTDLAGMVARYEASLLREALRATGGHAARAMERLNLPRKTFYDKLARHGIRAEEFRERREG
ncbi:sigma-54 dependent transcriptional regulator [Neomegalonema sp.]|uniref:sigma-54-dependent transcriptional regulator n=1 Tax=Neomegalonema sp. TaxID=2039713 RepID=UPI002633D6D7|nr:sigma-54 dependent transcriptional regulator [Neomegalonema sp.]MDD2869964.1 sigma-54 dependent transcriptional regulator [Neomegalonema sp.]